MKIIKIAGCTLLLSMALPASADIVHNDDVIITFSLCVGNDCVNGESFGFDTIRMKENNLRLNFADTSSSASFPTNDWRIVANDSSNGGANYLAFEDSNAGRQPFRVEAGAPANSLYVEDGGRIGLGTSSPVVDLHTVTGNTPTLRLEQDGSSGFGAQTWDVAGNEANFFIRDASNGSTLPFRIFPGAPSNALIIEGSTGDIGIGTTAPTEKLHVRNGDMRVQQTANEVAAKILLETAVGTWEIKQNGETGRMTFANSGTSGAPLKFDPQAVNNLLRVGVAGPSTVDIAGDLVISGSCSAGGGACADYVFEPDYELRSLDELDAFVTENRHLPNVPSADEMMQKGVNMSHLSGRLLEKIEELVLYTLEQQDTIDKQDDTIRKLEARVERIESEG